MEIGPVVAATNAGNAITDLHPGLPQFHGRTFDSLDIKALSACDLVFLALPHGESAAIAEQLPSTLRVVDLGADFRLQSASDWATFYSGKHAGSWTYGLTEFNRERIQSSTRIANPGCYATAIALGAIPIAEAIQGPLTVVAASGTTGAGRSSAANLTANEVMGNISPYKVGGVHQHTPEIEQSIRDFAGCQRQITFTPLLAPMPRGILATICGVTALSEMELRNIFREAYEQEEFISLLPAGQMPKTSATLGSNSVQIQIAKDQRTNMVSVLVALDNLGKGAAGQALQNANLACGLKEAEGLSVMGIRP